MRLSVSGPEISLSADSIHLETTPAVSDTATADLVISNSGSGSFAWTAQKGASWLDLSSWSGNDGDSVTLTATSDTLMPGDYSTEVVFTSPEAYNSPETLVVTFSVIDEATPVTDPTELSLPAEIGLAQNYPNPFNPTTTIEFSLPSRSDVTVEVFNILGQLVTTLADEALPAGLHSVEWDGHFNSGQAASSGIYFYRLRTETASIVRKMVLIK